MLRVLRRRLMAPDCKRALALSSLIALFATATLVHGQEPKQMAISFDDLPFGYARNLTMAKQREARGVSQVGRPNHGDVLSG